MAELLKVENLNVSFMSYAGEVKAVRNVSFHVNEKETLALVGESGCGKTVTSKSIMRLLGRTTAVIKEGSKIEFNGEDIVKMDKKRLAEIRGNDIAMIFQDSMTSLNPTMTVGKQIVENILNHNDIPKAQAMNRALELLKLVEIPNPEERLKVYPHQMSGGMRQRVMIAIALATNPKLLIADEPTTALDVTIQAQLMDLLGTLKERLGMSVILVTHDLGIVSDFADRVQVMYAGQVVERGTTDEIFNNPRHPYTWALLRSIPGLALEQKSKLYSLKGTPPDLLLTLSQCPFAARCDYCMPICTKQKPDETVLSDTHSTACWLLHPNAPKIDPPIGIGGQHNE
ncbi:MAG: ABC transporter ATP-binding protein [Clostridia bacterium]|nr:ABC transporter ATP-binding protein [Clostridia bacterium]